MSDTATLTAKQQAIYNFIRKHIEMKGFPPAMPTFKGKLSDKKINALIEFIKAQK